MGEMTKRKRKRRSNEENIVSSSTTTNHLTPNPRSYGVSPIRCVHSVHIIAHCIFTHSMFNAKDAARGWRFPFYIIDHVPLLMNLCVVHSC